MRSMMRSCVATVLMLLAALSATTICADDVVITVTRDVDACRALGFDADVLDCRRCDELSIFLTNDKLSDEKEGNKKKKASATLDADCRTCCTDVSALDLAAAKGKHQYDRVVLEVCTCKFGRYPKVANFVHYHAEKHAKLEIEYINARHPFLIFYDAEGNKKEEIGIASWDEDTISEFIVAKLKSDDTDAESQTEVTTTSEEEPTEAPASVEANAVDGAIEEPLEALDGDAEQQEDDAPDPSQENRNDEL